MQKHKPFSQVNKSASLKYWICALQHETSSGLCFEYEHCTYVRAGIKLSTAQGFSPSTLITEWCGVMSRNRPIDDVFSARCLFLSRANQVIKVAIVKPKHSLFFIFTWRQVFFTPQMLFMSSFCKLLSLDAGECHSFPPFLCFLFFILSHAEAQAHTQVD